jgi:hypothetical protein
MILNKKGQIGTILIIIAIVAVLAGGTYLLVKNASPTTGNAVANSNGLTGNAVAGNDNAAATTNTAATTNPAPAVTPTPTITTSGGGGSSGVSGGYYTYYELSNNACTLVQYFSFSDNPNDYTTQAACQAQIDTTVPVITLNGVDPINLILDDPAYVDAGATATDNVDGSIAVITTGTVDTTILGTYTITYTATDSHNNIATLTRTVNVAPPSP